MEKIDKAELRRSKGFCRCWGEGGRGWYRYKKRASPRRIKSRPFIHCLL